jgi:hypothetical protein
VASPPREPEAPLLPRALFAKKVQKLYLLAKKSTRDGCNVF